MKRSSRVFGTPIYLNGTPSISMDGSNTIQVVDGLGTSVECCAFNVANTAVNVLEFNATAAGTSPSIEVTGDDTDIDLVFTVKGTGVVEAGGDLKLSTDNIKDSNGNMAIGITATGSAVNYPVITNAAAGNPCSITTAGTDTDIDLDLISKGTGAVTTNAELFVGDNLKFEGANKQIWAESAGTGGKAVFEFSAADNAVNYLKVYGTATGVQPVLEATGTDTDIDVQITPKGTGMTALATDLKIAGTDIYDTNGNEMIGLTATGSAINNVNITNAAVGNSPVIEAVGDDTDINCELLGKGTGTIKASSDLQLATDNIKDSNGDMAVAINAAGTAVNYLQIGNAATGNSTTITATGTDANVEIEIAPKGTGATIVTSDLEVNGQLTLDADGTYGGGPQTLGTSRQTTDDAATVLQATTGIPVGTVLSITADVVAVETDETNRAVYRIHGLFYRNTAGDVTQQGATVSLNTIETDAAWDCDFVVNAGAQTIDLTVTGAAATTVNWKGVLDINIVMTS